MNDASRLHLSHVRNLHQQLRECLSQQQTAPPRAAQRSVPPSTTIRVLDTSVAGYVHRKNTQLQHDISHLQQQMALLLRKNHSDHQYMRELKHALSALNHELREKIQALMDLKNRVRQLEDENDGYAQVIHDDAGQIRQLKKKLYYAEH